MPELNNSQRYEINEMIDTKIKNFRDNDLKQFTELLLIERFQKFTRRLDRAEQVLSMVKWLAATVALLLIGTLYQLFVGLLSGGGKS